MNTRAMGGAESAFGGWEMPKVFSADMCQRELREVVSGALSARRIAYIAGIAGERI